MLFPMIHDHRQVRVAAITAGSGCADPGPSSRSSASPARSLPTPVVDSSPGRASHGWISWGKNMGKAEIRSWE